NGMLYRTAKRIEKWLMRESDGFVVLTEKAREIIFSQNQRTEMDDASFQANREEINGKPIEVIPCCVDFERRFPAKSEKSRDQIREKLGAEGRFIVTHIGAMGGLYLTEEIVDFLDA